MTMSLGKSLNGRLNSTKWIYAGIAVSLLSQNLFAYGERIESALDNSLTWACRVIGGAIFGWGLFTFFAHLSQDDPNAWKSAKNKIIGGLGFALIKDIIDLFRSFVGH